MNIFDVFKNRYSHKEAFLPDAVPLADLERIAEVGLSAPNGVNRQVVRLVILPDRASINPICKITPHPGLETTPAAIAVLTDTTITPPPPAINFEKEDYAAAVTQMLLAAGALGYSSLWLDYPYIDLTSKKKVTEILGAPSTLHLWAVLPIGKPDGPGSRRGRSPFSEKVSYGKFGEGKK